MTTTHVTHDLFQPPAAPMFGAALRRKLAQMGRSIWAALEAHGHARARQEMARLAERYAKTRPELAKALRAASK